MTTGDFDGDGKLDLVASGTGTVSILIGTGPGGFATPTNFLAGGDPFSITSADLNADGKLDLAIALESSDSVSVLLGDGHGAFGAPALFPVGNSPRSIVSGYFNADGYLDLATADTFSSGVSVLLGDGSGGFAPAASFAAGLTPRPLTVGDLNGDGKLDLITGNIGANTASVLLGNNDGTFNAPAAFAIGSLPWALATGDFNGDGKLDVASSNNLSDSVSVLIGDGLGGFAPKVDLPAGNFTGGLVAGDFDLDGTIDLAATNLGDDNVSVFRGDGLGGFAERDNFTVGDNPWWLVKGDFNGDGKLDLAAPNQISGSVSVLLNSCTSNAAPVANDDSFSTPEDTPLTAPVDGVLSNDTDGGPITATLVSGPANDPTFTLNPDGSFTYTPAENFNGTDSFTYKANDGSLDSNVATVDITVIPVNDAPKAFNELRVTKEDTPLSGSRLSAVDTDGENATLTAVLVTGPSNGTLALNPNRSFIYTPNANFNGSDSFTFKVNDGSLDSNVATVDIIVNPVNDVPVANGGSITTDEDMPSPAFTLTGSDADNDSLTFEIVTAPVKGTYNAATGIYTPNLNANGSDSFTFIAKDSVSQSSAVTVSITINPINDAPTANAQSVTTDEDTAEAITLSGSDPDDANTPLTYSVVGQPAHGALSGTGANLTYTQAANFSGTDSFTFRVSDGVLDSDTATVNITITAVNDAPTAVGDVYGTNEDTTLNIPAPGVLSGDSDMEGDQLTAILIAVPAHGSLTLNANGSFAYTPNLNFYGTDSFTYKANDGSLDSNVATVTITVNAVDDASVVSVTPSSQSVQYSDAISSVAVMATDVDAASLALSWQFKVNEGGFSNGLPLGLTVGWTCTSGQSCTASLTGTPIGPAGVYTIRFTANDGDRSVSADHILTVTKEHTETEFTGDLYALTAGPTVDTANVRLAAQLTQEEDGQPGYITKANVSFLLFNANNLGSTPDLTVSGVPVDASGAALTFVNVPVDTWTVKVKIDADNGYWKANPVGMGTITIERPTTELRTSGGGWVADVESVNGKGNFGFNVANQKKGVRGSSIYLFRGLDGFNYLVKSTSWNSGGVGFRSESAVISLASFSGKCVVQKIDPETGEVVESFGNYSFTVDVRDGDLFKPRQPDKYAITILESSGLEWRQVGSRTSPPVIGGGNVTVKGK